MAAKALLCMVSLLIASSFAAAADCNSNATLRVHFTDVRNVGIYSDLAKRVYVGFSGTVFYDNESIDLSTPDGRFITDSGYVEDVKGISLKRFDGGVRLLLYGSNSNSDKEILGAELVFENAHIVNFTNDLGNAITYPRRANRLENQGDKIYQPGNTSQDEVFFQVGSNNLSWFSTVTNDNDGFYIYLECDNPPVCKSDSDCGLDGYVSQPSCSGSNVTRLYQTFTCNNPATSQSSCSANNSTVVLEECAYGCSNATCYKPACGNSLVEVGEECDDGNLVSGDGCSQACKLESNIIYVVPYVGDIDGGVSPDWYFIFDNLTEFYDSNKIPVGFSFYPATIAQDSYFESIFRRMYLSSSIELIQKGYDGSAQEMAMDELSYDEQKAIVKKGQDAFRQRMSAILNTSSVSMPSTYDQIGARFTDVTRQALIDLGFNSYFDVYVGSGLQPVQPLESFDVIQYGVSFTTDGSAGMETYFKTPDQVVSDIKNFSRVDVPITRIDGHLVIPLWVHQQDFESKTVPAAIDKSKWDVYVKTMGLLKNDSGIKFVSPEQVYELRHGKITCKSNSDCGLDGYISNVSCSGSNVTRLYQTFTCSNSSTLQSSCSSSTVSQVVEVCQSQCSNGICTQPSNETANDTVQVGLCQFASSAVATSENSAGSLARYAVGKPDASSSGECQAWSGYGHSWTPSSWNVGATLTLSYNSSVYADNITILGDYDVCWKSIQLKNSKTNEVLQVFDGNENTCKLTKSFAGDFLADTVILETCGWAWCATDAVELCGQSNRTVEPPTPPPPPPLVSNVSVCTWKGCKKGAVSVSVDDMYTSCMDELEAQGYRGTYFLADTNTYPSSLWSQFDAAFRKGHELGTHMREHWCIEISDSKFYDNIEYNIQDITSNTAATRNDLVSHAYPCGFSTQNYSRILSSNWNFLSGRGYNFNQLDSSTPADFFSLKNYNSHGYPGDDLEPPSYFTAVDLAESNGKWLNLVFHNECSDDNVISYLPSKNVWVDTIGNVVRYIRLRDKVVISNYGELGSEVRFSLKIPDSMTQQFYSQNLTINAPLGVNKVSSIQVNNKTVSYNFFESVSGNSVTFDVTFPINSDVVIVKA